MLSLPRIIERPEQPYAFVPFSISMEQLRVPAEEGFPRLFGYLQQLGITPSAPPFYNYRRIDMADTLDVQAGVPVARAGQDGNGVRFAMLPAGRYATLDWHGPYEALEQVTAMLIGWVQLIGHGFDMVGKADGDYFACRLEIYEADSSAVSNPTDCVTTLAFKLRR